MTSETEAKDGDVSGNNTTDFEARPDRRTWLRWLLGVAAGLWGLKARPAWAQGALRIKIVILEASRKTAGFDPLLETLELAKELRGFGFVGAKVADQLETSIEQDASVTLEMFAKSKQRQALKVTFLERAKDTVRLKIAAPDLKFEVESKHINGGKFLGAHQLDEDRTLFFAVMPQKG